MQKIQLALCAAYCNECGARIAHPSKKRVVRWIMKHEHAFVSEDRVFVSVAWGQEGKVVWESAVKPRTIS